jgi:hypothetical protein
MLHYWKGELSRLDYMVIARSAIVHILYKLKYPERVEAKLRKETPLEIIEDAGIIENQLKRISKVNGLLLIKTKADIYKPLFMEHSARLKCPIAVLNQK